MPLFVSAFAVLAALAACRSTTGDASGGGGTGACGGVVCGADQFCRASICGEGQARCVLRPSSCEAGGPQVCGDDGEVYVNACAAQQAGRGLGSGCAAPAGTFACGSSFCDPASEYCQTAESTCGPSVMQCQRYPDICQTQPPPNCDCFPGTVACNGGNVADSTCTQSGDQFDVYCPQ